MLFFNMESEKYKISHCTMAQVLKEMGNRKNQCFGPHFFKFSCFRYKYLRFGLSAVSLLKEIWVRVDHGLLGKQIYKNQLQF